VVAGGSASCGLKWRRSTPDTIDFEITANRPDCLSVYGLAREASAAFDLDLKPIDTKGPEPKGTPQVPVSVGDAGCGRYALAVADVRIGPRRLAADRLLAAGVRPINNVVDVTNYVMLEWASLCTRSMCRGWAVRRSGSVARAPASRSSRWTASPGSSTKRCS
jgi:hypothetical protein